MNGERSFSLNGAKIFMDERFLATKIFAPHKKNDRLYYTDGIRNTSHLQIIHR